MAKNGHFPVFGQSVTVGIGHDPDGIERDPDGREIVTGGVEAVPGGIGSVTGGGGAVGGGIVFDAGRFTANNARPMAIHSRRAAKFTSIPPDAVIAKLDAGLHFDEPVEQGAH